MPGGRPKRLFELTEREREVVQCVEQGVLDTRTIARTLGISRHTAKRHIEIAMDKQNISSRKLLRS